MLENSQIKSRNGILYKRIMASVGAMVLLSLLSSTISLYKITEFNRLIEAINHVSVPLGRLFTQMQSDAELFHREAERSLGYSHWKDPRWKPRTLPKWIVEVLETEMNRINFLIQNNPNWASSETQTYWLEWLTQVLQQFTDLRVELDRLKVALQEKNELAASEIYSKWTLRINDWKKQLQWGSAEYERTLRQNFTAAESRVAELRTGLEMVLVIVVLMSLLLLWLGERALRPLADLTKLAREITRRGLRKADKSLLPEIPLTRNDEVSQLAREFHHMATALLEREKTVETQKNRVQEQNKQLREIGELNQNILNSINSIIIVTDLSGIVSQCNPEALRWLGGTAAQVMGSQLLAWPKLQILLGASSAGNQFLDRLKEASEILKLGPLMIDERVFGGSLMPLHQEQREAHGAILVIDDLTDEVNLQERLRQAENLAAIGRMSAQVAHEVRNPLHSIGLEAEIAVEMASQLGDQNLRTSLHSILTSVDRLQKITENYLKLSRLSSGRKTTVDLSILLKSVIATYTPACELQNVRISLDVEAGSNLEVWADPDLLEQVFGNLLKNSLQALEDDENSKECDKFVSWKVGNTETGQLWLRVEDNGPGISPEIRNRIFTPFVTTRAQGTGLGLSFVKRVIEAQGGTIRNIDQPADQGACFEIFLPLSNLLNQNWEEVEFGENIISG